MDINIFNSALNTIRSNLKNINYALPFNKDTAGHIYSAFVFSTIISISRLHGNNVTFHNQNGQATGTFIQRKSPGNIHSNANQYTYAQISNRHTSYDLHIGIQVHGKSRVMHECDLALLCNTISERCISRKIDPDHSNLRMFIECKYRTNDLILDVGRSFIGLATEFSNSKIGILVSNRNLLSITNLMKHYNSKQLYFLNIDTDYSEAHDYNYLFHLLYIILNYKKKLHTEKIRLIRLPKKP
ncbi:hypothetical protein [Desulfolutivibrio sulfoxidireducens]|uniref:hypothetical protein n=1 Tax=Desulfolutivibrio sulfoxidireducens TaxID=2773299 RepID=UPI00159E15E5|nr:hypothetical protein [Desulfolutivibrio sulfoxidireducens]QLA20941.1 hypothetical protein GD604_15040 [Desulfolutivibrio sulfoxidireducens]